MAPGTTTRAYRRLQPGWRVCETRVKSRLAKTLALMIEVLGDRPAAVGRELTKLFEEITRGTLGTALERYGRGTVKGELTIAVAGLAGSAGALLFTQ